MRTKAKIALSIPDSNADRYFLFRLKGDLFVEPSEFSMPEQILAISDIAGDFRAFSRLLIKNGVIDRYFNWTFSDGHLVVLGDCLDRGEQVVECLWLIYALEEKARKKGGYVHFLLGSHEIMNMNGAWRYVHPKYAGLSVSGQATANALYGGNDELWKWLSTKNIMEKIGDALFVHGGIATDLIELKASISEINNTARPYYSKAHYHYDDPLLFTIFNSPNSPFWYRVNYTSDVNEHQILQALNLYKVKRIVTGQTLVDHISSYLNGKVININSNYASGNSEALLIKKQKLYSVTQEGNRTPLEI